MRAVWRSPPRAPGRVPQAAPGVAAAHKAVEYARGGAARRAAPCRAGSVSPDTRQFRTHGDSVSAAGAATS